MTGFTIGTLAKKAGVNVETIRYYQRLGLLKEPEKPFGGFRSYPPTVIDDIQFIKRAQSIGFTLGEIRSLLLDDKKCSEVKELACQKLLDVKTKIEELEIIADTLKKLIHSCSSDKSECTLLESLRKKTCIPSSGN